MRPPQKLLGLPLEILLGQLPPSRLLLLSLTPWSGRS